MEKKYLIGKDDGYVRKIAFIDQREIGGKLTTEIMDIVEKSGNSEKYLGFEASSPTLYYFIDNPSLFKEIIQIHHQGALYQRHRTPSRAVIVFCHEKNFDSFDLSTTALDKILQFFS